jgi:hypothetical protein
MRNVKMSYDENYNKTSGMGSWEIKEGKIIWLRKTKTEKFDTVLRQYVTTETKVEELTPESQGLSKSCSFRILIVKDRTIENDNFETKKSKAFYQQIINIAVRPDQWNIYLRFNSSDKRYYVIDPVNGFCMLVPFESNSNIVCRKSSIKKCTLKTAKDILAKSGYGFGRVEGSGSSMFYGVTV